MKRSNFNSFESENKKLKIENHPWIHPTSSFVPLPEKGRPGGSSADSQYFKEQETDSLWIGKCSLTALSPEPYGSYREEFLEVLGARCYQHLGIETPQTTLSFQPLAPNTITTYEDLQVSASKPYLHLMSRVVEGFFECGNNFISDYRSQKTQGNTYFTVTIPQRGNYRLCGLGAALAAADFLHDVDCIGGSGGNLGYVIRFDSEGREYAQIIKIDPGFAFAFLHFDEENQVSQHTPLTRDLWIAPSQARLRFEDLITEDQKEFVQQAKRMLAIEPKEFEDLFSLACVPKGCLTTSDKTQLLEKKTVDCSVCTRVRSNVCSTSSTNSFRSYSLLE
jgi:hypothetical protein